MRIDVHRGKKSIEIKNDRFCGKHEFEIFFCRNGQQRTGVFVDIEMLKMLNELLNHDDIRSIINKS